MYKQAFTAFSDQALTVSGLLIFALFFAAVIWWVNLKSNSELYDKVANSPLNDGENL